jgi:hypothetical protein
VIISSGHVNPRSLVLHRTSPLHPQTAKSKRSNGADLSRVNRDLIQLVVEELVSVAR